MHTHFTQLYLAGNFPYLTDVVRISGREWGPTCPSHHLNLFPFMLFCHFRQSEQSLTKCNVFPISQMSCISTYSFESQSSPVQLITLKATYLPNILRMRVNLLPTQNESCTKYIPLLCQIWPQLLQKSSLFYQQSLGMIQTRVPNSQYSLILHIHLMTRSELQFS